MGLCLDKSVRGKWRGLRKWPCGGKTLEKGGLGSTGKGKEIKVSDLGNEGGG